MQCLIKSIIISLFICLTTTGVQADNLSDHEKQIKEGFDRIREQISAMKQRPDIHLRRPELIRPDFSTLEDSDQCFNIMTVDIQGSHILSKDEIKEITSIFTEKCLGLVHINELTAAISNLYLEQGYVTSRAYIAPQDLSDGILELVVIEGVIEDFQSVDGSISISQLNLAFPSQVNDVVNIRALEHGIENLNSIGQNNAKLALVPGANQGGTLITISNQVNRSWSGSLGINNNGVPSTGEYQLDGSLVFDNVFDLNDSAFFSVSTNVGGHELQHAESRSYSGSWSVPLGYWQLALTHNFYTYEQIVTGDVLDFSTSGSSSNSAIQFGRNVYRSQTDKVNVTASFTKKDSKNYIEDVFLETSSRTLYVWNLETNYRHFMELGTLNVSAQITKSVPWFRAKRELVSAEDDFQFTKYQFNLGFSTSTEIYGQPLMYSASAQFLYSQEEILASEGLTVGGRYSVRGLSQGSLFGYKGGYLRNDISVPLQFDWAYLNQFQYFLGLDIGVSNLPEYPDKNQEWVAGSIIGFKWFDSTFSIIGSYASALRVPDFLQKKQQEIDINIRLNF